MADDDARVVEDHVAGAGAAFGDGARREQQAAREERADDGETDSLGCVHG
ncbi:hypothetical protein GCM10010425_46170 [Streptomyces spororaveus]|uniref:Uncharacterized protein n=1 Tax=Streptomyces spororaveus TaxID=284039 RepID=A0ABQ3T8M3_9ACTN|nr:hypothetical protein Sspor_23190 [Streptomyces spororaveus]